MSKISKRMRAIREKVTLGQVYPTDEAIEMLKSLSQLKFTESMDVAIKLGVDSRKSDQVVRGSTVLPNGLGKEVRVAVFTQGENAEKAKAAGADVVGMDDLAKLMQDGDLNFDKVIATPDAMPVVGRLGPLLGPRGLMPNPKDGTVSPDVEAAVKNAKAGQISFRTDKAGIIHASIGKASFEVSKLRENLEALLKDLAKAKPASAKGHYLQKVSVSTTMGPGIIIDHNELA